VWHSVFALIGILAGSALGITLAREVIALDDGYAVAIGAVLGGLFVSRLFHVVDQWSYYAAHLDAIIAIGNGGASVVGAIVGGIVGGAIVIARRGLPLLATLDRGIVGLPLGMAIGRIGDVINGEHWATRCEGLPWCVRYTSPTTLGQREYVHPAVAYELVLDLVIVAILLLLLRRGRSAPVHGRVPFVFLALYGVVRLSLAPLRLDPIWLLGVSQAVIVSIAFVLVGIAGLMWRVRARAYSA
jgi:phosphatidylglycerol:prolipoprotein diacylglycerol transferase